MGYKVYIKKDDNTIGNRNTISSRDRWCLASALIILILISIFIFLDIDRNYPDENRSLTTNATNNKNIYLTGLVSSSVMQTNSSQKQNIFEPEIEDIQPEYESIDEMIVHVEPEKSPEPDPWQTIIVKKGDSLSRIFSRLSISPRILHDIININDETKRLKKIKPGEEIKFKFDADEFLALEYDLSLTDKLSIMLSDDKYIADISHTPLEIQTAEVHGVIDSSLFLAAQAAGMSDNLIMELIALYGWDIDFVLDIREGDEFFVIHEEHFKNGEKVKDGPILAAEFVNQNNHIRAVRYIHEDGHSDYYNETGHNMRKAFLRTPVNFTRISSRFNLRRKHPILNKIRAHRGVDYAAPNGTAVKATGDGIVAFAGNKGGYGRTVTLRHGEIYSTLYAHLSKYARGIKTGKRVKQGQTIGYVGMTGLATGPHLHYEFRINGVHRNPLTVKLPKAIRIPDKDMERFVQQTSPLFAQLDILTDKPIQYAEEGTTSGKVVALHEESETDSHKTQ